MTTHAQTSTGRPWTFEDRHQLVQLINAGFTVSVIVKELGRGSVGAVWDAIRRYDIAYDSSRPRYRIKGDRPVRGGGGRRWTTAELDELARLSRLGLSAAAIAELLPSRTQSAIVRQRKTMGLSHHYRRGPRKPVPFDLDDTGEI